MTITKKLITDFSNERLFIHFILYIYNLKIKNQSIVGAPARI